MTLEAMTSCFLSSHLVSSSSMARYSVVSWLNGPQRVGRFISPEDVGWLRFACRVVGAKDGE